MKKIKVRIFTEEYFIEVRIGTREQILKSAAKYLGVSLQAIKNDFGNCRGRAWNGLDEVYGNKHPIIVVDGDYPAHVALATLAHEASHAMDFIASYVGMSTRERGEFHAHGIAAVMRAGGKLIIKKA